MAKAGELKLECRLVDGWQWWEVAQLVDGLEVWRTQGFPTAEEAIQAAEQLAASFGGAHDGTAP